MKKTLKLALEALEPEPYLADWYVEKHIKPAAIKALEQELMKLENEAPEVPMMPVAQHYKILEMYVKVNMNMKKEINNV